MTKKKKENNKNKFIKECLGIFMIGTLDEMYSTIKLIYQKYFPHKDDYLINAFINYFIALRDVVYASDFIKDALNKYR